MTLFAPVLAAERVFPLSKPDQEHVVPLSLLDSITVDFSASCGTWLFRSTADQVNWPDHLRHCLRITLNAYPQLCGQLGLFTNILEDAEGVPTSVGAGSSASLANTETVLPNAQRYGRVYARYGAPEDPGVEYITASTTATVDDLYPATRTQSHPLWDHESFSLTKLVPSTPLSDPRSLKSGPPLPLMDVQLTQFACAGFALSVRCVHPLADAQALVQFVRNWASISQSVRRGSVPPSFELTPIFDPTLLDATAAGDINASKPDPSIIEQAHQLPFHRYDWWIPPTDGSPHVAKIPPEYQDRLIAPAGTPIPWAEWDMVSPVSHYTIHLTQGQVESIFQRATNTSTTTFPTPNQRQPPRISRHDAVLAHIWDRIIRARNQQNDPGPIHCDLTLGARPPLNLPSALVGSFVMMMNIEIIPASTPISSASSPVAAVTAALAHRIRETIDQSTRRDLLAAHLHGLAFEDSPQRIWQGFLGTRHLMVTSWARAGLYDVDFGSGSPCYAEGVVGNLDGLVVIQEGPSSQSSSSSSSSSGWTKDGVDVSVRLRKVDMDNLLKDEGLFGGL